MTERSEAEVRQLYHAIWGYKADEMRRLLDEKPDLLTVDFNVIGCAGTPLGLSIKGCNHSAALERSQLLVKRGALLQSCEDDFDIRFFFLAKEYTKSQEEWQQFLNSLPLPPSLPDWVDQSALSPANLRASAPAASTLGKRPRDDEFAVFLRKLTVGTLKNICNDLKISNESEGRKEELIERIIDDEAR